MLIEHNVKVILATLVIVLSWTLAVQTFASEPRADEPVWLWSDAAPLSAAAAEAFSTGDIGRGLRLSKTALANADTRHGRFIAHHNMCVAHAMRGHVRSANRHCQESHRLAAANFRIVDKDTGQPAREVLNRNLAQVGFNDPGF